ncbi:hypothetical protein SAMN05444272_0832 [Roseibium suaedae]|uniref:Uncharacterized protein n=1 Tax=Roseibium suaedae TaxID=735517 RepID=A0A1M7BGU6_9HYPH|nr:hypothetical protein SAMN05444272_0832 [Roseibium suaedae]
MAGLYVEFAGFHHSKKNLWWNALENTSRMKLHVCRLDPASHLASKPGTQGRGGSKSRAFCWHFSFLEACEEFEEVVAKALSR